MDMPAARVAEVSRPFVGEDAHFLNLGSTWLRSSALRCAFSIACRSISEASCGDGGFDDPAGEVGVPDVPSTERGVGSERSALGRGEAPILDVAEDGAGPEVVVVEPPPATGTLEASPPESVVGPAVPSERVRRSSIARRMITDIGAPVLRDSSSSHTRTSSGIRTITCCIPVCLQIQRCIASDICR